MCSKLSGGSVYTILLERRLLPPELIVRCNVELVGWPSPEKLTVRLRSMGDSLAVLEGLVGGEEGGRARKWLVEGALGEGAPE